MEHKYKDIEGSRREFTVKVPQDMVRRKLDEIFEKMKESVNISGFRKGKVPLDILEKYHGKDARERALTDLVAESYRKAMEESNTVPIGLPHISDVEFKEVGNLTYKATIDIKPKVDLKRYRNIKVKKKKIELKDEDIERYISTLKESYAQFKGVEERPAKLGDCLVCDINCQVDGRPIYSKKKNIWLLLDKGHSMPELIDGLVGVKVNEERLIKAHLPENPNEPRYSKKEALFKIKVNQIKEKELPELNDEFVKTLGTYKDVAELKEAVRRDLVRKREDIARQETANQILDELLKNTSFSPPKGLVDDETKRLTQEAEENLKRRNLKKEDIEKKMGELQKDLEKEAIKRVRLYFILDEIGKKENITVDDKEIDDMLLLTAQQSNKSKEEIKKYYKDNDLIGHLKNQIKENKIIDFLLQNAEIRTIN